MMMLTTTLGVHKLCVYTHTTSYFVLCTLFKKRKTTSLPRNQSNNVLVIRFLVCNLIFGAYQHSAGTIWDMMLKKISIYCLNASMQPCMCLCKTCLCRYVDFAGSIRECDQFRCLSTAICCVRCINMYTSTYIHVPVSPGTGMSKFEAGSIGSLHLRTT